MKILIDIPSKDYKELTQTGENTINLGALLDLRNALSAGTPYAEQKNGRWIYGEDEYGIDGYRCDKCGFFVLWDYVHKFINYIDDYKFCPACGSRMEREE